MNINKFIRRFWGRSYGPCSDFLRNPSRYGGTSGSHIKAQWTTWEHFAHDNYGRGHLPQLCITASGWKARLIALFLWPKSPYEPIEYVVWWKNGDHPHDDVWRVFEDTGEKPKVPREGKIVRYFRHPTISGNIECDICGHIMNNHGWIDNGADGRKVCPGDYVPVEVSQK